MRLRKVKLELRNTDPLIEITLSRQEVAIVVAALGPIMGGSGPGDKAHDMYQALQDILNIRNPYPSEILRNEACGWPGRGSWVTEWPEDLA